MKHTYLLLFVFPFFLFSVQPLPLVPKPVSGPFFYAMAAPTPGPVYKIDLMNCEICPVFYPAGPPGNFVVQATALVDAFCYCQ
jgi:hypothetical protein